MKKTTQSKKSSVGSKGSVPGPFIESGKTDESDNADPESSGPADRQEVRQEIHRENVPRQSQRPVERSNQPRSRRP